MTPQEQADKIVDEWRGFADRNYEVDTKELRRKIAEALETRDKIVAECLQQLHSDEVIFRSYAALHSSKMTAEGDRKANENRAHADRIAAFLQSLKEKGYS